MPNALFTAVSGLIAHQRMLEVVGNNLANMNTTGYKASSVQFSDLLYNTIRPATTASDTDLGGTNPNQIGSGVKIAEITRKFSQGTLEQTGEAFDFAISGEGFFVVNDGSGNLFTRAGSFALDSDGNLVDPATGFRVQRFGIVGEETSSSPGFQQPGDSSINVPLGMLIPGAVTTELGVSGNVDSALSKPMAQVLTSITPITTSGSAATGLTLLNDLDSNTVDYVGGDSIQITGMDVDGTVIASTLAVDAAATVNDLLNAINTAYPGATASLDANGNIALAADTEGTASLSLLLEDDAANTGATALSGHRMEVTTLGADGATFETSVEVMDERGEAHTIVLTFQKQDDSTWDMTASMSAADGVVLDGSVSNLRFQENGDFDQALGTGLGDANLSFQFAGMTAPQEVNVSLQTLSHRASDSTIKIDQDGFPPGTLSAVNVGLDGMVEGVTTTGRSLPLAQLAISMFSNPQGLIAAGNSFFRESLNSGTPQVGTATSGGRGSLQGAQLESSNVDIALEFTRLIVAQRGFSANARSVTISDEVLEELTNVVR